MLYKGRARRWCCLHALKPSLAHTQSGDEWGWPDEDQCQRLKGDAYYDDACIVQNMLSNDCDNITDATAVTRATTFEQCNAKSGCFNLDLNVVTAIDSQDCQVL
jgi:hypothetical protein